MMMMNDQQFDNRRMLDEILEDEGYGCHGFGAIPAAPLRVGPTPNDSLLQSTIPFPDNGHHVLTASSSFAVATNLHQAITIGWTYYRCAEGRRQQKKKRQDDGRC
jgi:hypothetical protein